MKGLENTEDFIDPVQSQIRAFKNHIFQTDRRYNRKIYDKTKHKKDFEFSIPTRNSWRERKKMYLDLLQIIEGFINQMGDVWKTGDQYSKS